MSQQLIQQLESLISQVQQSEFKPSPQAWSVKEVLGHLLDSACNNHQRFVRAKPGKVVEFPAYDPDRFVGQSQYQDYQFDALAQLVLEYNFLLHFITQNFKSDILGAEVSISQSGPYTVEYLIEDYWRHFELHLNQIRRLIDLAQAA